MIPSKAQALIAEFGGRNLENLFRLLNIGDTVDEVLTLAVDNGVITPLQADKIEAAFKE
jgi:hypothetical protein